MKEKELDINAITVEMGTNRELTVKGKGKINIDRVKIKEDREAEDVKQFEHNDENIIDMDN